MWDYTINIYRSELLSTKTKEFKINKLEKKSAFDRLHFIPNNIFTKFFKELIKYKNNY